MDFNLTSEFQPTGDQPEAIAQLTEGILQGRPSQVLLGVTGSGKTFTIANVIANINKPTLILSHNKTLAAQLYSEFKGFFPNNAVEYYLMAVAAARTKNTKEMAVALSKAIDMQPDLKNWAATDISFYPYKGDAVFMQIMK